MKYTGYRGPCGQNCIRDDDTRCYSGCPHPAMKEQQKGLQEVVREFLSILDVQEESSQGSLFRPTKISSCRVLTLKRIGELLELMKENIK